VRCSGETISRAALAEAVEQAADAIVITDSDGCIEYVNPAFTRMTGYSSQEALGLNPRVLKSGKQLRSFYKTLWETIRSGKVWQGEVVNRRKDGSTYVEEMRIAPILGANSEIKGYVAIKRDITERRVAEEALQSSESRYRTIFETSLDGIAITRLSDGIHIDTNKKFLDLMGYRREEVIGKTTVELGMWVDLDDRRKWVEVLRQASVFRDVKVRLRKKNGEVFWSQNSSSLIEIDGASYVLTAVRDISEAKAAEDKIRSLACYDTLTGLPNRGLAVEQLRQTLEASLRSQRKGALLFVDMDNLKTLNETHGHRTGDLLLQEVARRLSGCIRAADTVARFAGDEFLIVLENLSEALDEAAKQANAVAEKILFAVQQPYLLDGRECLSAASIGITLFGLSHDSVDDVLQQADIAMYQAKSAGRSKVTTFYPALQTAVNTRATMEEELREAIRTNQFLLYYQPQFERGNLIGAEALVRWKHPKRGIVPPDEFIPIAEGTGMILQLGYWVLESACTQIAALTKRKETAHITIAVNISALEFRQHDFAQIVLSILDRTGANPKNLKLELTESMLVENVEDIIVKMTELKCHGLRFSLDDFGTGYSSLSYLKRLPLDELKIDRAFVRDMLVDATSGAIAKTIISLSKAMGLSVIAEGVESEDQREFLAGQGCHSFQGYLFSRPLPAQEFQLLLSGL
jgi:diguanylate cyclase (GGDEF)-like protein/PAS domain S-box-containing protein